MDLIFWVLLFALEALFWCWILFWGGAERLEGTFTSGFLVSWWAPNWSAEGIKLFALVMLIGSSLWFLVGLFLPAVRLF